MATLTTYNGAPLDDAMFAGVVVALDDENTAVAAEAGIFLTMHGGQAGLDEVLQALVLGNHECADDIFGALNNLFLDGYPLVAQLRLLVADPATSATARAEAVETLASFTRP